MGQRQEPGHSVIGSSNGGVCLGEVAAQSKRLTGHTRKVFAFRALGMAVLLVAGWGWLAPRPIADTGADVHFEERAAVAHCQNAHSKVVLSPAFKNIMPWLSSVGAAVAVADYDNDGYPDIYVVN